MIKLSSEAHLRGSDGEQHKQLVPDLRQRQRHSSNEEAAAGGDQRNGDTEDFERAPCMRSARAGRHKGLPRELRFRQHFRGGVQDAVTMRWAWDPNLILQPACMHQQSCTAAGAEAAARPCVRADVMHAAAETSR